MDTKRALLVIGTIMLVGAELLFPEVEPVMAGGRVIFSARGWTQFGVHLFAILALAGFMAMETPGTITALRRMDVRPTRALARLAVTGAGVGATIHLAAPYHTLAAAAVIGVGCLGLLSWRGVKTEL